MNTFLNAEVVLVLHDKALGLREGDPSFFLYWPGKAQLFEEPTRFMIERYQVGSKHTWATASYGLKSWFQYLQAVECHWQQASLETRREFRDAYLTSVSPKTGEKYDEAGVKANMTVVRRFYEFAGERDWYHGDMSPVLLPSQRQAPIDSDPLAHTRSAPAIREKDLDLPKVTKSARVRALRREQIKRLFSYLGPRPSERGPEDQRPSRDRVFAELGLCVGLRLGELNNLTTLQFLNLTVDEQAPYSRLPLTIRRGKGNKTRQVEIPSWLVMEVLLYIDGERREALEHSKRKKGQHAETSLFLAHEDANAPGVPITDNAFQDMFEKACFAVGLVELVEKQLPETGEKLIAKRAAFCVHDLRHSYAVYTYHALVALGDKEPWKKIQAQLGHASLQTTMNTYLACVEIFSDKPGLKEFRQLVGL